LIRKQVEQNGLKDGHLTISDGAVLGIIREYTKEAGVRNLEREISTICRKVAREIVQNGQGLKVKVAAKSLPKYLGVPRFRFGKREEKDLVGVATGLAWTEFGGDLLQVEASIMPGRGNLVLTGKLGDVMKESAQAALSYVRSRARQLLLPNGFYEKIDVHIHVPEGAIPKDGPSAGIALCTAIVSALTRWPVRSNVAMTGEITLRGRVLPIGGLKEKILAGHRGGIEKVLVPAENKRDLEEIPEKVLKRLEIVLVEHMDEVLRHTLAVPQAEDLFRKELDFEPFCISDLIGLPESSDQVTATH
jgi:ATP-dependent Lon protease